MKFKKYQDKALETALPTSLTPSYLIPMIIGEIGDCFGKVAKAVRDDWSEERLNGELAKECGDVCWGVALLAKHYGLTKIDRWGTDYRLQNRAQSLHFLLADVSTLGGITRNGNGSGRAQVRNLWLNLEDNCELLTGHSFDKVLNMSLTKIADHKVSNDISGSEPLMADPTPQNEAQSASAHPGDEPIYTKRNNKMTTAIKLCEIEDGRQAEYQLNPPTTVTESGVSMEVTYLISSHSTLTGLVGHETMLFPSDGDGNIISYMDLYYMPGHVDHDVAVQSFLEENTHE